VKEKGRGGRRGAEAGAPAPVAMALF